jgi:hypothetical protein
LRSLSIYFLHLDQLDLIKPKLRQLLQEISENYVLVLSLLLLIDGMYVWE